MCVIGTGRECKRMGVYFFSAQRQMSSKQLCILKPFWLQCGSDSSLLLGRNGSSSSPIQLAGVRANAKTNPIPKIKTDRHIC